MKVLVVEDDESVRAALRSALLLSGYDVLLAEGGRPGLAKAENYSPDVIVLDIRMPDLDGLEVCRALRYAGNRTPILMLTARHAVAQRIEGLDAGADDYLVKPYDVDELRARVRALIRRSAGGEDDGRLTFAELQLDPHAHTVRVGEREVDLTRTEFHLLELLMLNSRRVLTPAVIYDRIWGHDFGGGGNLVRVNVGNLRRKLEAGGERRLVQTVHGIGYILREP